MTQIAGTQLIEGHFTKAGGQTFQAKNPATGTHLPTVFFEASAEELDRACGAAAAAFVTYENKSGAEKASLLETIASQIEALGAELLETAHVETGLPLARLEGERGRTCGQLRLFASLLQEGSWVRAVIDMALPNRSPQPRPDLRRMERPLGPVAVFGASNFPLAFSVAGGDTASALAAGCPVVFKGHPAHPATCALVGRAIAAAVQAFDMPAGVFSLLQGASHAVGMGLVQHPSIRAVGFTGSFGGGKALFDAAQKRAEPIPVYAEMGSVNPVFFLPGALQEGGPALATQFAASITLGMGQFCTNPGLFVLPRQAAAESFVNAIRAALKTQAAGPMLTDAIKNNYLTGVRELARLTGVKLNDATARPYLFLTDAVHLQQNPGLAEEVFGPCSLGVQYQSLEELLAVAAGLKGHLTVTVHGTPEDLEAHADLLQLLQHKAGRLVLNGFPTGVEVAHAMVHGGPFPATTDSRSTSVGTSAIYRFTRPVCFQNFPDALLPPALQAANPLGILRMVDGQYTR